MLFRRSLRNKSDYKETSKTEISKIRCQIGIFTALPKIQLKNITQQRQSQFLLSQVFKNGI